MRETEPDLSPDDRMAALFADMIVQQTNMALVFLGQLPHPDTQKPIQDLEAAQMFIDQLEMLAVKTRGNLSHEEDRLLQQGLMMLRMEFVQTVKKAGADSRMKPSETPSASPPTPPGSNPSDHPATVAAPMPDTEESRKRFTKKY